jgi:predicted DCC family thiol-disulfide oxidoreductase YuxK
MLADATTSPLFGLFPSVLRLSDAPIAVTLLLLLGAGAGVFLAIGSHDKLAALIAWYVLACLFTRNPLIANPALPYLGWMLLAHVFIPSYPIGSVAAMRRPEKAFAWTMPHPIFLAAWIVLALSYSYSGYTKLLSPSWVSGDTVHLVLQNPLARDHLLRSWALALPESALRGLTWFILVVELLFAPLALVRALRPVLWGLMLFVQVGFLFLLNFADLTIPMLLFHLLTFDPAWFRRARTSGSESLFYDGVCGFCHRVVRFALAEDTRGGFRFAPLQGERFKATVSPRLDSGLSDTIVVVDEQGRLLLKSDAVIHLLDRLGGLWWFAAVMLRAVPRRLRDAGYDAVGRIRPYLFPRPDSMCPIVPPQLRARFAE